MIPRIWSSCDGETRPDKGGRVVVTPLPLGDIEETSLSLRITLAAAVGRDGDCSLQLCGATMGASRTHLVIPSPPGSSLSLFTGKNIITQIMCVARCQERRPTATYPCRPACLCPSISRACLATYDLNLFFSPSFLHSLLIMYFIFSRHSTRPRDAPAPLLLAPLRVATGSRDVMNICHTIQVHILRRARYAELRRSHRVSVRPSVRPSASGSVARPLPKSQAAAGRTGEA